MSPTNHLQRTVTLFSGMSCLGFCHEYAWLMVNLYSAWVFENYRVLSEHRLKSVKSVGCTSISGLQGLPCSLPEILIRVKGGEGGVALDLDCSSFEDLLLFLEDAKSSLYS